MSIATQITRLNNNIEAMKTTKQQIKDAMNNDFDIIANEQIESYDTLIENGLELYKDCIPSEVTNQATEISVTDAMKYSRNKLQLFGNTEQASYTGKNLFNIGNTTVSSGGINWIPQNDGSLKIQGTATGTATYGPTSKKTILAGQYTFSRVNPMSQKLKLRCKKISDSTYWYTSVPIGNTSAIINIPEDMSSIQLYIDTELSAGDELDYTIYPQLEQGSTVTDFEPYVGGVPSPNPDYPQDIHVVTGNNTVGVQGKNLFDKDNTVEGILTENGTISSGSQYVTSDFIEIDSSKAYTKTVTNSARVKFYDASKNVISTSSYSDIANFGPQQTFTIPYSNAKYIRYSVNKSIVDTQQLEEGSTATSFEPYYHQEYTVNLITGNIFDKNNANILNALISSDGTLHASSTEKTLYIKCKPNTTYTISKIKSKRLRADERSTVPTIESANVNRITNDARTSMTYTTSENGNYLLVGYYVNTDEVTEQQILDSIQIKEAPIELCKIGDYQDYLYKENGNWYKYGAVGEIILNGSESGWAKSSTTNIDRFTKNTNDYISNVNSKCNYFTRSTVSDYSTGKFCNNVGVQLVFNFTEYGTTTLEQWKTWLSTHNLVLYQPLQEATITQITDETLIAQLDAIYEHLQLTKGINNITITSGDLAPYMKLSYKNYESNLTNE